jgi:hypothetical protein
VTNLATELADWPRRSSDKSLKVLIFYIKISIIILYYNLILAFYTSSNSRKSECRTTGIWETKNTKKNKIKKNL